MPELVGQYNLALCQVTLGSFSITGFGDDDAITITPKSDLQESAASADGKHIVYSMLNDPRHDVVIVVRRTSPAFRQLGELLDAQVAQAQVGAVSPLPFLFYDPVSGDRVSAQAARFMKRPELKNGRKVGTAEFKLEVPSPRISYGPNL